MDKVTVIVLQPFDLLYKILEEKEYSLLEHFSVQLYIRSEFSVFVIFWDIKHQAVTSPMLSMWIILISLVI